jgi:uncharacterized protein YebE (UPF0316 family)
MAGMDHAHLLTAGFVFVARVCDVALGTFRFSLVVSGRRAVAWGVAFVEASIWLLAASRVFKNLDDPIFAVAFALGFATGTFAGMTIERAFALGEQIVRVFTRAGVEMAGLLRAEGYIVTRITGEGRDGPVDLLFIQVQRRRASELIERARAIDAACFYVIDDVRAVGAASRRAAVPIRR